MEEDIKILEDYIELIKKGYCEECNELCNIYGTPTYPARKISEATEHLIKAYKELEEENIQLEACKDEVIRRYNFESIPVSLVEEKIEELNKQYNFYNSDRRETKSIAKGYYIAIQKLEELLEKRK